MKKSICILGIGAIGSNLTSYLASDLRDEYNISVLDRDNVEERNIIAGTQNFLREQIGLPKVEALQFNIYKQYSKNIKTVHQEIGYSKWPH